MDHAPMKSMNLTEAAVISDISRRQKQPREPKRVGSVAQHVKRDVLSRITPERQAEIQRQLERERRRQCASRSTKVRRLLYPSLGKVYHDCTLDNFEIYHDDQPNVLARLRDLAERLPEYTTEGRGLVFYGPSGTGKDHLATAMLKEAISRHCRGCWSGGGCTDSFERPDCLKCWCLNARELCSTMASRAEGLIARAVLGTHSEYGIGGLYDVVLVQDPAPYEPRHQQWLYRVIDGRIRDGLSTWLTINVTSRKEGEKLLSKSVFDRFTYRAETFYCNWPSYRTKTE